jgi:hypothetical protein
VRTLHFEPDSRKYERLYGCLMVAPIQLRDRQEQRTHGSLLDKLEAIGQVKPAIDVNTGKVRDFMPDELRFMVTVTGGEIVLEDAEYEIAKRFCDACVPVIHHSLSRELERTLAWLDALPQEAAAVAKPSEVPAAG